MSKTAASLAGMVQGFPSTFPSPGTGQLAGATKELISGDASAAARALANIADANNVSADAGAAEGDVVDGDIREAGAKLIDLDKEEVVVNPTPPVAPTTFRSNGPPAQNDDSNKTIIIVVIAVLFAVAIGGALLYVYFRGGSGKRSRRLEMDDDEMSDVSAGEPAEVVAELPAGARRKR